MTDDGTLPLKGYKVIDLTENMAGPLGTMILADQGADVIKVESLRGDMMRNSGVGAPGLSAWFANLNRSKRSIAIDLREPRGRAALEPLLDSADAVVHSIRPDAARRLGIDAKTIRESRPTAVHAAIVGYGTTGPYAGRPVYDHVIQALSGLAASQAGGNAQDPELIRQGIVDKTSGHVLAQSICAAWLGRVRTGQGASVEVNMLDVAISLLWPDGMTKQTVAHPSVIRASSASSFRLTPTSDGHVAIVALTGAQWSGLMSALDLPLGRCDERGTPENPAESFRAARARLRSMDTDEAVQRLGTHDVPCAPVLSLDDVAIHPQVAANELMLESEHPVLGAIRQPRPIPFHASAHALARPAPSLGEHSIEVLREAGLIEGHIQELIDQGIVLSA